MRSRSSENVQKVDKKEPNTVSNCNEWHDERHGGSACAEDL